MFNKFLKNLKISVNPVKAASGLAGMDQMSAVKDIQAKVSENQEDSEKKFDELCSDGLESLEAFSANTQNQYLKTALEKFIKALEIKKSKPEPYFYLAVIAYISGDVELTDKYLDIIREIEPDFQPMKDFVHQLNELENKKNNNEEQETDAASEIIESELLNTAIVGQELYDSALFSILEVYEAQEKKIPSAVNPARTVLTGQNPSFKPRTTLNSNVKPLNTFKKLR